MVTLLGFFFILGNIGLLVIFMPDLVGPVSTYHYPSVNHTNSNRLQPGTWMALLQFRPGPLHVPNYGQRGWQAGKENRHV